MDAIPLQDSVCAKLGMSSRWIGTGLSLAPSFRSSPSGCADLLEAGHQQPLKPVRTSAAFQAQLLAPGGHGPGDLLIRKAPVWWPDPCHDVRSGQSAGTLSGKIAGVHSAPAAA